MPSVPALILSLVTVFAASLHSQVKALVGGIFPSLSFFGVLDRVSSTFHTGGAEKFRKQGFTFLVQPFVTLLEGSPLVLRSA
jgi:hypothetical protein